MKKSKMKNKKVYIGDIKFDSIKEGNRYKELKIFEKAGVISDLKLQVRFELIPKIYFSKTDKTYHFFLKNQKPKKSENMVSLTLGTAYIADFTYKEKGVLIVEDVKPTYRTKKSEYWYKKTKTYKDFEKKRNLMRKIFSIEIKEV